MRTSTPFLLALIIAVFVWGCEGEPDPPRDFTSAPPPAAGMDEPEFRHDGTLQFIRDGEEIVEIAIEIAETEVARTRGLMQRESLPERSGMLFIFDEEAPRSFWMANTPLSLDIVFADSDSQIVTIRKYTRPMSPQSVVSNDPSRFVVEVVAGFTDSHGILEGDRIRWERDEHEIPLP
ncbi:MAG: DUF192 domain-containing protein [Bacteroidota bacterium]